MRTINAIIPRVIITKMGIVMVGTAPAAATLTIKKQAMGVSNMKNKTLVRLASMTLA